MTEWRIRMDIMGVETEEEAEDLVSKLLDYIYETNSGTLVSFRLIEEKIE